jgi:hypothetical protein
MQPSWLNDHSKGEHGKLEHTSPRVGKTLKRAQSPNYEEHLLKLDSVNYYIIVDYKVKH